MSLTTLLAALLAKKAEDYFPEFEAYQTAVHDAVLAIGGKMVGTSTSSVTVQAGTANFTIEADKHFAAGSLATAYVTADPSIVMSGPVTSYDPATGALVMSIPADGFSGSGTFSAWTVLNAPRGPQGPAGGIAGGTLTGSIDADGFSITNVAALIVNGLSTFTGGSLFQAGAQWQQTDLGTVSTGQSVAADADGFIKATLGADVTFTFGLPTTGHGYSKLVKIVQDGTGGRVPTLQLSGPVAVVWIGDEPPWGSRTSGQSNYVTILVTPDGEIFASAFYGSA
jgi:hypothetical protein